MTPEQFIKMEDRVTALEEENKKLRDYSLIPYEVRKAFEFALPSLTAESNVTGSFVTTGLERTINLSGGAEAIKVLEYPTGYIAVSFAGASRKIPFFTD